MSDHCPFCQKLIDLAKLPGEDLVWEFPHSIAFLGPWQYYTGYCVLVARQHASELSQLTWGERRGYLDEMCILAQAIESCFQPHKLNYELLGNQVPHLHWHLFPRRLDDPERLRPVWFALDRADRDEQEKEKLQTGTLARAEVVRRLKKDLEQRAS